MSIKKFNDPDFYNVRLYETEHFAVIPTLGSLVEGWLLIIPKQHYLSFGYLQSDKLYNELEELIDYVGTIVKNVYGNYVVFENGAFCTDKLVGCGVDYAHIHIVPTNFNLLDIVEKQFSVKYNWEQVSLLKSTSYYIKNNKPYLFYKNQQGNSYITTDVEIPSQLFRKAIAYAMGLNQEFDWKNNHFLDNIHKTIANYKNLFN